MPGSISIPSDRVTDPFTGLYSSVDELKETFQSMGVRLEEPIILTCGSGVTACILFIALKIIGAKDVQVVNLIYWLLIHF